MSCWRKITQTDRQSSGFSPLLLKVWRGSLCTDFLFSRRSGVVSIWITSWWVNLQSIRTYHTGTLSETVSTSSVQVSCPASIVLPAVAPQTDDLCTARDSWVTLWVPRQLDSLCCRGPKPWKYSLPCRCCSFGLATSFQPFCATESSPLCSAWLAAFSLKYPKDRWSCRARRCP